MEILNTLHSFETAHDKWRKRKYIKIQKDAVRENINQGMFIACKCKLSYCMFSLVKYMRNR